MTGEFLSRPPSVTLESASIRPFDMAVGTAKQCYSALNFTMDRVPDGNNSEEADKIERNRALVEDIVKSGHHTTIQHQHYTFWLGNISRQFTWTFLHSHQFYNSEQQSQRYVELKGLKKGASKDEFEKANFFIPPLEGPALDIYVECANRQFDDYNKLRNELLPEIVANNYYENFPARQSASISDKKKKAYASTLEKKCQELARYVVPVAAFTKMYHTVSLVSLLRYGRMCETFDVPQEQKAVVQQMINLAIKDDPQIAKLVQDPLPLEETPEYEMIKRLNGCFGRYAEDNDGHMININNKFFREEFDSKLDGKISKLVDYQGNAEQTLVDSIKSVFGLSEKMLKKEIAKEFGLPCAEAVSDQLYFPYVIGMALDPMRNKLLGERFNQTTMSKLSRVLYNVNYVFAKKLSHTGDSQDQRHRMTPGARPTLHAYLTDEPDFVYPMLLENADAVIVSKAGGNLDKLLISQARARNFFEESMDKSWDAIAKLRALGVSDEYCSYLLPNAVSIRFYETLPLHGFHHKAKMRLCLNSQEEIFRATVQEVEQINDVHGFIGSYFGAPCHLRDKADVKPPCPEGGRYCGVPIWKSEPSEIEKLRFL